MTAATRPVLDCAAASTAISSPRSTTGLRRKMPMEPPNGSHPAADRAAGGFGPIWAAGLRLAASFALHSMTTQIAPGAPMSNVVGHFIILAGAGIAACALSIAFGRPDQAATPDQAAVVVTLPQRAGEPATRTAIGEP